MSYELFYTSAPKGLQPGSRGFCTVACTKGMPTPLIERVEALSGYRPLFPPHDAKAALNPVNWAHVQLTVAGRTYHVLSRVCSAGLDYTDRTNKLAHHVVLEPHELPQGGPAWLLRQPGFMETKWDGQVCYLPTSRMSPQGDAQPVACREWKRLAGDAGWAGVVVDSFLKNPDRPVYLIFAPGMDLLPLLAEAVALLPPAQRWRVTFNAYLSGLPAGVTCAWRGVAKNSDDAATALRVPGALVINLADKMGPPPPSAGAEAARAGKTIAAESPAVPVAVAAPGGPPPLPVSAGGKYVPVAKPAGVVVRAPALPPPPLPGVRTELKGSGRSRAGFGVGMVAGVVTSLIPLAALVATGMMLVPSLGVGTNDAAPSAMALTTGTEPASSTSTSDSRLYEALRKRYNELDDKYRDLKADREAKVADLEKKGGELEDAKNKLKGYEDRSKKKPDPKPDERPIVAKAEYDRVVQAKDDKIKDLEMKVNGLKAELGRRTRPEQPQKVVALQFDLGNGAMNKQVPLDKPSNMRLFPLGSTIADVPIRKPTPKDKNPERLFFEQKPSGSRLTLELSGKALANNMKSVVLASFEVDNGRLKFSWDENTSNREAVKDIRKRLEEILPHQILEIRTPSRPEPERISLCRSKTKQFDNHGLPVADFEKLIDEIAKPYPVLNDPTKTAPVEWQSHLLMADKAKKGKGIRLIPRKGAAIYMHVKDRNNEDDWLVELCRWE